jgi:hypothetical protein
MLFSFSRKTKDDLPRVKSARMVDRQYRKDLPVLRSKLERLRDNFSQIDSKTDWVSLRIDPVLNHLRSLQQLLDSSEFAEEFSRLTKGVVLFHSDLVYFRKNIEGLEKILQSEKKSPRAKK